MEKRYRLIRRGTRGGTYYCVDSQTGSRTSLGKISADEAEQIVQHKNTALRQPMLNLQIARAYLAGSDSGVTTRTWGKPTKRINYKFLPMAKRLLLECTEELKSFGLL